MAMASRWSGRSSSGKKRGTQIGKSAQLQSATKTAKSSGSRAMTARQDAGRRAQTGAARARKRAHLPAGTVATRAGAPSSTLFDPVGSAIGVAAYHRSVA